MPKFIVIDGIIGAGKTTFIGELEKELSSRGMGVVVIPEPVGIWVKSGRLQQFYKEPRKRAYQFQTRAFHDRITLSRRLYRESPKNTDVFILERSIFTDVIFMKTLLDEGTIDITEYEDYLDLWKMWKNLLPFRPDVFVYIRPGVEESMRRVRIRDRDSENLITESYQTLLQKNHDQFLDTDAIRIEEEDGSVIVSKVLKITSRGDIRKDADFRDDTIDKILEKMMMKR